MFDRIDRIGRMSKTSIYLARFLRVARGTEESENGISLKDGLGSNEC